MMINTLREGEDYVACSTIDDDFEKLCTRVAATILHATETNVFVGSIHDSELLSLLRAHAAISSTPVPTRVRMGKEEMITAELVLSRAIIGGNIDVVVDDENDALWFAQRDLPRLNNFLREIEHG